MAVIPKEHDALYFDKLIRTKKKDVVQALIKATYFADKNVNRVRSFCATHSESRGRMKVDTGCNG